MKSLFLLFFITLFAHISFSQEICDNGIDDDLDGLIDLQDTTDCFCQLVKADSSISSLIPNPSFESRTCCPSAASQLNCANNWIQASGATSDYFNTCGLRAIGTRPQPPLPLPDGNGYVGFFDDFFAFASSIIYKEYVGTCLLDTTQIGVNYQIEFFLAISSGNLSTELAIFGSTNCSSLPFGNLLPTATSLCPTAVAPADWDLLAVDTVTCSTSSWVKVTLNFTATQNYSAIILGPSCSNNMGSNYYYIDNLILNKSSLFVPKVGIIDSGNYCQNNLILKADFDSIPRFFQWYRDSIAIVGATDSAYSVPNGQLGNYQLLATYDSLCVVTDIYKVDTTIVQFDLDSAGTCSTGLQTGEILISNLKSGTIPYQFQPNNSPFVNDSSFTGLSSGLYTVTVQDSNGCQGVQTITVDSFPQPVASFLSDSVCLGIPSNFIDQSTLSSGSITDWQWSLPGNPSTANTSFTFPSDGNFPITLTVVSDSGCVDDTTLVSVVHPLPNASFTFTPQELYTFNSDVCFINQSTGTNFYAWDFDFAGVDGTSNLSDPCTVRFPTNQEKVYQVTLVAETQFGCMDSATANVSILDEFLIYIPSAFSPNADGLNDEFVITAAGVQSLSFQLFNRWGELVFNSTETNTTWDGTQNGTPMQQGVYVYRATVRGQNGVVKELFGHVNLVK